MLPYPAFCHIVLCFILGYLVGCGINPLYVPSQDDTGSPFILEHVVGGISGEPSSIRFTNGGDQLYFASIEERYYGIINMKSIVAGGRASDVERHPLPCSPNAFDINHKDTEIYFVCNGSDKETGRLLKYSRSTNKLLGEIRLTADFYGASLSISTDDSTIYLVDYHGIHVSVIDNEKFVITRGIALKQPSGWRSVLSPRGNRLYVLHPDFESISVINADEQSVIQQMFGAGKYPTSLLVSNDGNFLYSLSNDSPTITIIDTTVFKTSSWKLQQDALLPLFKEEQQSYIYTPDIYPDGDQYLYIWYPHLSTLFIVDIKRKTTLPLVFKKNYQAGSMAFNGKFLALTSKDSNIYFYRKSLAHSAMEPNRPMVPNKVSN
jgi:hypothetical protein